MERNFMKIHHINRNCRILKWRYLQYMAYFSGDIPAKYGQKYGTVQYLHKSDPGIPIDCVDHSRAAFAMGFWGALALRLRSAFPGRSSRFVSGLLVQIAEAFGTLKPDSWGNIYSMDWFSWENLNRKLWF